MGERRRAPTPRLRRPRDVSGAVAAPRDPAGRGPGRPGVPVTPGPGHPTGSSRPTRSVRAVRPGRFGAPRRISHASHTPETSRHARVGGRVDNRCRRWGARARHRRTGETPVRRPGPDGTEPTRARVLSGPEMAHPRSCPRPVGGFTRVLRSPDLKWPVRFCQTGPVAPRRRGRSRHSLGRALLPWFFGQDNGPPPGQ